VSWQKEKEKACDSEKSILLTLEIFFNVFKKN
jgi:hypothetical protein